MCELSKRFVNSPNHWGCVVFGALGIRMLNTCVGTFAGALSRHPDCELVAVRVDSPWLFHWSPVEVLDSVCTSVYGEWHEFQRLELFDDLWERPVSARQWPFDGEKVSCPPDGWGDCHERVPHLFEESHVLVDFLPRLFRTFGPLEV